MNKLCEHETSDSLKVTDLSILLGLVPAIKHTQLSKSVKFFKIILPKGRVWFSGTSWVFSVCFRKVRFQKAGFKTAKEAEAAKSAYLQRRINQL